MALLTALLTATASEARSQDAVIRGRVIDDRGEAVPVATVRIAELTMGALTNSEGRYTLLVPSVRVSGQVVTLQVRQIGHKPVTRRITLTPGEQTVDVTLATDVNLLEAVVVTGTQEATAAVMVPFSVTHLDASKLPVVGSDPLTMLQGKVAANIVSQSGRPGAQPAVLLRGPSSLNAAGRSQDPLYIVDGVVINGALPDLNSNDIESVEVVKGAAGASLYGARAGNGVINITTKTGSRAGEGVQFSTRNEVGVSDIERDFGIAQRTALLMDAQGQQFCDNRAGPTCSRTFDYAFWQSHINNQPTDWSGTPPNFAVDPGATISGPVLRQRFQIDPWPGQMFNAVRQAVQEKPYVQNNVDMTGRYGGTRFYASASNLTEQGALRYLNGLQRNSFRANVDQAVGSQWNIAVRTFYSRSSQDGTNQEDGGIDAFSSGFFQLTRVPAIANVLLTDQTGRLYIRPNLQQGGGQNSNPLYNIQNVNRDDITNRFLGAVTAQFTPASWAEFDASFSYDQRRTEAHLFLDKGYRTTEEDPSVNNGFLFRQATSNEELGTSVNAVFRHDLAPDLRGRVNLRYAYEQRDSSLVYGEGDFLAFKGIDALTNVTQDKVDSSWAQSVRQIGLFAGAGLEYKGRYILDGLVRRDGSSLFGADHRWQTFGRISGAWRVAQEPWWFTDKVTEFKMRASYGTAGGSPAYSSQYETFGIGAGGIPQPLFLGNRDLGPEIHHETELGVDLELLGKFGLTATYARSRISDQILPAPVSAGTSYQRQWRNAGELLNKTWELTLNIPFVRTRDLSWTMGVVYDRNRSVITKLDVPPYNYGPTGQNDEQIFKAQVGEEVGTFYGRHFLKDGDCGMLPAPFNADCGPGKSFQTNSDGFLVWVGPGNNPGMGITNNLWQTSLPAGSAPWNVSLNWGTPIILRGATGPTDATAKQVVVGNALPRFRFAITQNVTWKRLTIYGLLDASIGQDIWNQGFAWAHLDFLSKDVDQTGKSVQDAKPIGYYYRAKPPDNTRGIGGLYDILFPNNFSVEKSSYAKLRELLVAYHLGPIGGVGDWQVSVVGRNVFTITDYRGFDPEVGLTSLGGQANSGAVNAVDYFTFPNLRTFTFGVSTTF